MQMSVVFLSLFPLVFSSVVVDPVSTSEDTLVLLHVLFRHGNRTPDKISKFPNDPHANQTFEPYGYGQLTTKGKKTEYEIGQYLRRTYGKFIPKQYTPDVVYGLSTNYKRTKMSLELVLAALFPPLLPDLFAAVNWQPVPFNIEQGVGLLGFPMLYCPNYVFQYLSYIRSEEAQKIVANYQELYQQLSLHTGIDVKSPETVASIFATLQSEKDYGLKLPNWTSSIFPEVMDEAAGVFYEFLAGTTPLKRHASGFLLKKILDDSVAKRDGILSPNSKVFLYSAHDVNVGTMLNTFGVFERHVPPYGATIFFEIHNVHGIYGLKVFYQKHSHVTPEFLTIPGCSSFCELDRLYELFGGYLPGDKDVCSPLNEIY